MTVSITNRACTNGYAGAGGPLQQVMPGDPDVRGGEKVDWE